jgi:NitT/TauT family transport system permease protein
MSRRAAHPWQQRADVVLLVVMAVLLWQGIYRVAGASALSSPLETAITLLGLLRSPIFLTHLRATGSALALSFALTIVLGLPLGLALGLRRFAGEVFEPVLASLYTIPKVTLYPVVLALFGLGLGAKVAFGVMHGVIPVVLITLNAVRAIPPVHIKTARVLRLTPWQVATAILLPAILPELCTALRVGFSLTLLGVLVGEMFASQRGLGFLLIKGITTFDVSTSIAITVLIIAFGATSGALLLALDRRLHRRISHPA